MDILWAPWRMQFIDELRGREKGCVFCELALPGDDREKLVLHRGKVSYVLMNRFPYNNGHLMVIPYRHTGSLSELSAEEHSEMMGLSAASIDIMTNKLEADGFNCGMNIGKPAGAGIVDHVHMHVVPRWVGDVNFMPIMSDTRSMPEYLAQTYDRMVGEFKKLNTCMSS